MFFLVNIIPANVDRLEMEVARFYKEESEEQAKKKQDKYFDLFLLRVTQGKNVLESERDFPYIW